MMRLHVRTAEVRGKSFVDGAAKAMAEHVAATHTRRGMLFNLATGVGALFGIRFAAPQVVDTLFSMPSAEARARRACTHPHPGCANIDLNCGMGNTFDCRVYKDNSGRGQACANCFDDKTGCPRNLTKGTGSWKACCKCKEDVTKGTFVEYYDCCGKANQFSVFCNTVKCQDLANNPLNPTGCANIANCQPPLPAGNTNSWCGTTPGMPICSFGTDTKVACS